MNHHEESSAGKWPFEALEFSGLEEAEMQQQALAFYQKIKRRRTVREYSDKPVPRDIIENAIRAAGTAPSGANMQPWHFVAISNAEVKQRIREAAEIEEKELYSHRAGDEWLKALEPLGTNEHKPFLETAPWLIAVFLKKFTIGADGVKFKNYYTAESVGIACGFLLAALHNAGLVTLTHTPSPMGFLSKVLERPKHDRAYILIVTGYPADDAQVPSISRRSLEEIATFRD